MNFKSPEALSIATNGPGDDGALSNRPGADQDPPPLGPPSASSDDAQGAASNAHSADEALSTAQSTALIANLVANHREFLRFLERRVGSRAEAEDILQAAFVKGVEKAGSLRDGESSTVWFYRMLRNAVIDHQRRRSSAGRALDAFAAELDGATTPPAEVEQVVCRCVKTLADTLKPEYADALRRVEVDGLTVQGFAAEAGIQPNNAAVRLFRARDALRKRVMDACGTCAEHGCIDCTCHHEKAPLA